MAKKKKRHNQSGIVKKHTLPSRFKPGLLDDCDNRLSMVKELRRRIQRLRDDVGATSYQQELLCERAIFVSVQLETMERRAVETGELDASAYCQTVNVLSSLLSKLGLKRATKQVQSLESYVTSKRSKK